MNHTNPTETIPANRYKYSVETNNNNIITLERDDETLEIGRVDQLLHYFDNGTARDEMNIKINVRTFIEHMLVDPQFGDRIRDTPPNETLSDGTPKRVMKFYALVRTQIKHGFERRGTPTKHVA